MPQIKMYVDNEAENLSYNSLFNFKLRHYNGNVGTTVQPIIKEYLQFDFSGKMKIESHYDVAQIMAVLENKSSEHFFVVHVNKDKEPLIQYLSTGNRDCVMVDKLNVHAIVGQHKTKDLYLVHNHPSGTLKPSEADLNLTKSFIDIYSNLDVNISHLIINTYKREYVLMDDNLRYMTFPQIEKHSLAQQKAITYQDMEFLREPIGLVKNSQDAFSLIQQIRFSALPKYGVLVLSNSNHAIGNFFLKTFDLKSIAKIVASVPSGTRVIGYGNKKVLDITPLHTKLRQFGVSLLDYIEFNSNSLGVKGAYKSYADESLLCEIQEKYQTNQVQDKPEISQKTSTFFNR